MDAIGQLVGAADQVLAITHLRPDGDALGSLTAMGVALRQLGKQVTLACDDGLPERFAYLPLSYDVQRVPDPTRDYDLVIALDCGDAGRMGKAYTALAEPPPIINIDHHVTNTRFGRINLVDVAATSTAEILYELLPRLGASLNSDLATCLLTGLVTDTLCFRTVGVTSRTLHAAGSLVDAGANLNEITMQTLSVQPLNTLLLYRHGLANMRLEEGLLWTTLSQEACTEAGYLGNSSGGLVNLLGDVAEAAMGAVLMEQDDGRVVVGFRCRPPYDVSELALNLGGGGHALAAGCILDGPLEAAESLVVDLGKDTIRRQTRLFGV